MFVAETIIRNSILQDVTHFGIRLTIGVIFIVHSMGKFDPGFAEYLPSIGLGPEIELLFRVIVFVWGALLIIGVLSRISAVLSTLLMLLAIFVIKGAQYFSGERGVELDIILMAGCLSIIVIGPGKISLSYILKKIPRGLQ